MLKGISVPATMTVALIAVSLGSAAAQSTPAEDYTVCANFGPDGPDPAGEHPMSRPPAPLNGPRAVALIDSLTHVLAAEERGSALVWFLVDAEGDLRDVRIARSSGFPAVDSAAVSVGRQLRFKPAEYNGHPVCIWFARPLSFGGG